MPRHSMAIIHLDAIVANYLLASSFAPDSKNIAVIKADAYGHGSIQVAKVLQPYVPAFAVAIFEEAVQLREAGITKPILVLQGINDHAELVYASHHDIWLMIHNEQQLSLLLQSPLQKTVKVWFKLDTGMHRLGLAPSSIINTYKSLSACDWVDNTVVLCSHLACASVPQDDETLDAIKYFYQLCQPISELQQRGNLEFSLANSAALISQEEIRLNWNRPGIMLYGVSPFNEKNELANALQPAMTLLSSVIAIRELAIGESVGYGLNWTAQRPSIIATLAIGYADGYPRHAASGTPVMVKGQIAKLVGNVSMDMITIDITDCHDIILGDEVELWGRNINISDVAQYSKTIGYELITRVSKRIPRLYHSN